MSAWKMTRPQRSSAMGSPAPEYTPAGVEWPPEVGVKVPRKETREEAERREGDRRARGRRARVLRAAALFLPGALPVLLSAALGATGFPKEGAPTAAPVWAGVALGAAVLLAARLRRWRLLLAALLASLLWGLSALWAQGGWALPGAGRTLFALFSLTLPVCLGLWGTLRERNPVTRRGLLLWGLPLTVAAFLCAFGARFSELGWGNALAAPGVETLPLPWGGLPWPTLAVTLTSALVLAALAVRRRGAGEAALAWAAVGAALAFGAGRPDGAFALHLAAAAAALALGAVEASRALSYRDELTGLPGRRALEEALAELPGRFAAAMVDVDHFKAFNDQHGHAAGDQALQRVASRLGEVGGGGRPFRYGGEEFAVLFPGRGAKEALPHLEALREALASEPFVVRGKERRRKAGKGPEAPPAIEVHITVSVGLAEGNRGDDPAQVLRAADRALYRAKEGGRNRTCR